MRRLAWIVVLLGACGGGGGGEGSRSASAALSASQVSGRVAPAPEGTLVHLLGPAPAAPTLATLGDTVQDSVEPDATGAFALRVAGPGPHRVLVSAPGLALTWVDAGGPPEITPAPEARLALSVVDEAGRPEAAATLVVVDPTRGPLPLSPLESVADEAGRLTAGRLPGGAFEVLVVSCDLTRARRVAVVTGAGETTSARVVLRDDPALVGRVARLFGQDGLADLLEGVSR